MTYIAYIHKTLMSLKHAFRGVRFALQTERNFKTELVLILLGIVFLVYFKFSYIEIAVFILAGTATLAAELLNSAIESSWDKLHPEIHHSVGRIKDLAAAGVLMIGLGTGIIFAIITIHHFFF